MEEETVTARAPDAQTLLTSSTESPPASGPASEIASQAPAQLFNTVTLTPKTDELHGGDSPGGWTISLGTVQVSCCYITPQTRQIDTVPSE